MARVRFIGSEPVAVPELGDRLVEPDEVVEVPDDRYEGYVCQPTNWESVEEPGTKAAAKKTAAKPPQKEEG
ncbi:hypothetical protein ACH4TQ_46735 [Streptomyces sp. NPDC021218]|uniref:hypothetical protein n=1 Tax=Streptomyces sp. NPDC021218 TaxID=3365119 RepID=UPI00379BC343